MKCPKCGYTSFDYLRECKKCGEILDDCRQSLNLKMVEPTLFANLGDKPAEDLDNKDRPTIEASEATFSDPDFLSPPATPQTGPSTVKRASPDLERAAHNDITTGLGSLGSMNNIQPRPKESGITADSPKIELGATDNEVYSGLELTPSFNPVIDDTPCARPAENKKQDEFSLFEDESSPQNDFGKLIEDDIPFEFSANDLESDIDFKAASDNSDNDLVELELDMEDEESLDQILADLQTDK